MEKGLNTYVIYLDFAMAYDKVDISTLSGKIRSLGIMENIGGLIGRFMANRTQKVKIMDTLLSEIVVRSGVQQDLVMVPILIIIFILDMVIRSLVKSYIYVDDSKLIKAIRNEDNVSQFQDEMEEFY